MDYGKQLLGKDERIRVPVTKYEIVVCRKLHPRTIELAHAEDLIVVWTQQPNVLENPNISRGRRRRKGREVAQSVRIQRQVCTAAEAVAPFDNIPSPGL
jgi:hypothetical protein